MDDFEFDDHGDDITGYNISTCLTWRMPPKKSRSDWTIVVVNSSNDGTSSTTTFHVHQNILSVGLWRSEYFEALFDNPQLSEHRNNTSTIKLSALQCQAMPLMLDCIYRHNCDSALTVEHAVALRSLAMYFRVRVLYYEIKSFLMWQVRVVSNLPTLVKHAGLLNDQAVLDMAKETCTDCLAKEGVTAESSVESMIDFLKRDLDDAEQASMALSNIAHLCLADNVAFKFGNSPCPATTTRVLLAQLDVPLMMLGAMKKHKASAAVQAQSCKNLANFLLYNTDGLRETFALLGGIEVVIAALKEFQKHLDVQASGMTVFCIIASTESLSAALLVDAEGVPAIIAAMKMFPDDEDVQHRGCTALFNLSKWGNAVHNVQIEEAGGIDVLNAARKKYKTRNTSIWHCAGLVIGNIMPRVDSD